MAPDLVYYLLNKPDGVITTAETPRAGPPSWRWCRPSRGSSRSGRLDRHTEGLLILTNDGALSQLLTHPSHGVAKEYVAEVDGGTPAPGALRSLRQGVELDDGLTAPAEVGVLAPGRPAPGHPRGAQPPGPPDVRAPSAIRCGAWCAPGSGRCATPSWRPGTGGC